MLLACTFCRHTQIYKWNLEHPCGKSTKIIFPAEAFERTNSVTRYFQVTNCKRMFEFFTTDIDECKSTPCKNGATCVDGVDSYKCQCVAGYDGDNCENGTRLFSVG